MHLMHNPWLRAKSHCIISLSPKLYVGGGKKHTATERMNKFSICSMPKRRNEDVPVQAASPAEAAGDVGTD